MLELEFLIVCAFYYCLYRLAQRFRSRGQARPVLGTADRTAPAALDEADRAASAPQVRAPAPSAGELLTLADWAFDYERMVIGGDTPHALQERALHVISRLILPLVGHVRVCELDDELVRSVNRVVAAQLREDQAREAGRVWAHFVGWIRYHAAPPERRNIWTMLDTEVLRTYDEFTDR